MRRFTIVFVLAAAVFAGCGSSDGPAMPDGAEGLVSDAGPQHVHGLGVNEADGALYIATHSGLWRADRKSDV
jgi:hypothetical protein